MGDAILVAHFGGRRVFGFGEDFIHAPLRIGIEHKKLAGVGLRVAEKLKTVGFGPGESLFVAKDNAGGIVFEMACSDEAATRATLFRAGHRVFLRISVEGRSGILLDDAVANPVFEACGGAGVNIVLRSVVGIGAALFDCNQIVRVASVIFLLHGGRDFVVRLREDALERGAGRIVTEGAKGKNLSHRISGMYIRRRRSLPVYAKRRKISKWDPSGWIYRREDSATADRRNNRNIATCENAARQPAGISNVFVTNENVDMLAHLALLGGDAIAEARIELPQGRQSFR